MQDYGSLSDFAGVSRNIPLLMQPVLSVVRMKHNEKSCIFAITKFDVKFFALLAFQIPFCSLKDYLNPKTSEKCTHTHANS